MPDAKNLIEKVKAYNPEADTELIRRAYDFAYGAHSDQMRISGEPYITHPLATAEILADLEMDTVSIAAALLHDVVEDQDVSVDNIRKEFGDEIAVLVDGVTKLALAEFEVVEDILEEPEDAPKKKRAEFKRSAENLRKIFLAMARDLRVMVIKLADRLHNMSTLQDVPREQQIKVSRETMQIYAPLAHRLGIWMIKWELEDLAFK